MKVIARNVEMVAWFDSKGEATPIKFRYKNSDESLSVIKIDKVIQREREKLGGNLMVIFRCKSNINGIEKIYELKYELSTCIWMLWKI